MSRIIGRPPSIFKDNRSTEDESDVFSDETNSFHSFCGSSLKRNIRIPICRNSDKLQSIDLNEKRRKNVITRKGKDTRNTENPFKKYMIPDEVLRVIFSNLKKRDLLSVMFVCKTFYVIGNKCDNWLVTDFMERPISEVSLITLMRRKIKVLRLAGAKPDPTVRAEKRLFEMTLLGFSFLEYLDISRANLTYRQLLIILKPCQKLTCLSIEGNIVDDQIANCISSNRNLRKLDISMTEGITPNGAKTILKECTKLEEFNASWCGLSNSVLNVICTTITKKIQRLNLAGTLRNIGLNNRHIEALANISNDLIDLDLSDNVELDDSVIHTIFSQFPKLKKVSLNRCYGIDPNVIIHLNNKPTLKNLNVHGCLTDSNMELFLEMCSRLHVNLQFFNDTAKPVSHKSSDTQIWGQDLLEK